MSEKSEYTEYTGALLYGHPLSLDMHLIFKFSFVIGAIEDRCFYTHWLSNY